ncbi:uncharacterized protein SPPG_09497 [Spizellomyces punctatus DAOM BR117]|uniref:Uncharacterized protein n=1 Tax=Spizellomyces punctatus (strain DAOM BR117) TaxID=645134 RepID=A0A0L0H8D7_SPIPD|nr:uncharacterized protein SPPG_09497 [Spizellomyces punctatus DAOM BR117]KNC96953.1 hypothetical protein SPPG_09497 [Spizellomyces punctatus DAOM BR117]|eukprot:XP_016604993.1 hypothetical protein SPPG_09497 [Spizellomyces punctatus DAOM BR117]
MYTFDITPSRHIFYNTELWKAKFHTNNATPLSGKFTDFSITTSATCLRVLGRRTNLATAVVVHRQPLTAQRFFVSDPQRSIRSHRRSHYWRQETTANNRRHQGPRHLLCRLRFSHPRRNERSSWIRSACFE